ncbi:hypothetical protein [Corallococcus silvisoli]|uniref:hypothetical protein n=1 Tax=Corallococcus silvisoli TaxID=2697031 RepID=UPI0013776B99|nr:hypothetical protein [Corallococcus silvisoli]NBD11842.1 hypothetical protein [Corallococcus silvisoli]
MQKEQIEQLTEETDRRDQLFIAVEERLAEVEKEIPRLLAEARSIRTNKEMWENFRLSSEKWGELEGLSVRLDALIKEHAVLEGIKDRRDVRRWRWIQLLVGGSAAGAVAAIVQRLIAFFS